jgi:5-methylcytosine-specific restriction endonuclease McrA
MAEVDCPVDDCEYSTETNRGLAIHASSKHPDLDYDFTNRKEYECPQCEEIFKDYPSRRESKDSNNYFCSKECKHLFEAKDGLDTECSECGEEIHIPKSRVGEVGEYEQKNYFCDKDCESSFKSREWVGKDHPSWNGGRERVSCEECGGTYKVHPHNIEQTRFCSAECRREDWKKYPSKYNCANCGEIVEKMPHNVKGDETTCSKECLKEHLSSIRKGEENPAWKGGRFNYYGPNWPEQREKALERDSYSCQECDMTRDQHYQNYDEDLHVHHKVPRRQIIDEEEPTIEQFELANSLDNLVTLCKSCHRKLESS